MPDRPPLTEQEHADLVAYLDGELHGEAARALARRLTLDPRYRAEAEALGRAWELLDHLPQAAPSPAFTHRTLERVSGMRPAVRPARRRAWVLALGWAAALLLTVGAGFVGVSLLVPADRTDAKLVHDLHVIDNRRLYEPIDDVDFLWELSQPDLFGDDTPGS